jgi:outer membrane protein TolC
VIGALLLWTVVTAAGPDSIPVVTLAQALEAGLAVSPDYVRSVGQLENADWGRRAAKLTFLIPTITANASYQELSTSQFNVGIGQAASATGSASLDARYELFAGGRKWQTARLASAEFDRAAAGEVGARFLAALETERDYYAVLGARELLEVARQRRARAEEQFALARARVLSGATVQSDSLQLLLERQRAETEVLTRDAALTVARLQLGRRVGVGGPVDAAAMPDAPPPAFDLDLDDAVRLAVEDGPAWRQARASERAAVAALKAQRGSYLPTVTLNATLSAFDSKFFPTATKRRAIGFAVSWPLWNGGQREVQMQQLGTARDVARVVREDLERGARHDVTEAYTSYDVARRTLAIAESAVAVATEVLRVQQARYQAGSSTVLELLDAQTQVAVAGADRVNARYATRLARAGLEAILGMRLSPDSKPSRP